MVDSELASSKSNTPPMSVGLFIWSFGALFYLLGFFHRVAPAVITGELMRDFQISAAALGNLSAFYFYSYVAMQIPTGILADRLGPRRLLTCGAIITAVGAIIFASAPTLVWAGAGRLLIGGSVAVAFVGLLKIATSWFAPHRFALVSGLALLFGIFGAVFAGSPMRILVDHFGWRSVIFCSALASLCVAVGTWMFVRDYPRERGYADFLVAKKKDPQTAPPEGILNDLRQLLRYRNTILLFIIPGGIVGSILTFSGLWGVPYLTGLKGLSPAEAATLTSMMLVAWAIGSPIFGWLSDRLHNRKRLYLAGCTVSVAGWATMVLVPTLPLSFFIPLLLITGFSSGCMIISFAFAKESVPLRLAGTISGVINMGVMSGPMILQPAVGLVLDHMWSGESAMGIRVYDVLAYRYGFGLMLGWIFLSLILLLFTKETACRQMLD